MVWRNFKVNRKKRMWKDNLEDEQAIVLLGIDSSGNGDGVGR